MEENNEDIANTARIPTVCRECKQELLRGAKKCTHANCGAYQDWRRHKGFLPLLIALIAATTALVTTLGDKIAQILPKKESITVSVESAGIQGGILVSAQNKGDIPGIVYVGPMICRDDRIPLESNSLEIPQFPVPAKGIQVHLFVVDDCDDPFLLSVRSVFDNSTESESTYEIEPINREHYDYKITPVKTKLHDIVRSLRNRTANDYLSNITPKFSIELVDPFSYESDKLELQIEIENLGKFTIGRTDRTTVGFYDHPVSADESQDEPDQARAIFGKKFTWSWSLRPLRNIGSGQKGTLTLEIVPTTNRIESTVYYRMYITFKTRGIDYEWLRKVLSEKGESVDNLEAKASWTHVLTGELHF